MFAICELINYGKYSESYVAVLHPDFLYSKTLFLTYAAASHCFQAITENCSLVLWESHRLGNSNYQMSKLPCRFSETNFEVSIDIYMKYMYIWVNVMEIIRFNFYQC